MKSLVLVSLVSAFTATFAVAEATQMRDAATHQDLVMLARKASLEDPMRKQIVSKGPDPSVVNRPKDLLSDSDIICFNGAVTLVPKGAIMQIPKNLSDRLKYQKGAKLMSWADFYAINRGWITTVEVSRVQAEGNSPIAEETQKQIGKSKNLMVATYQSGPISMLPPKVAVEATTKAPQL